MIEKNPKSETLNSKQIQSTKKQNSKQYDLEDRTLRFAKDVIMFVKSVPKNLSNIEIVKQLIRSSTSVGANYIEANESLSKKDFLMRIKICRKEAKESIYWLKLIETKTEDENKKTILIREATELMKIFGSIVVKTE